MGILSSAVLLFLVMDPFGNIPFFIATLRSVDPRRHRLIVARELLIALGVLVFFFFAGRPILKVLSISEPALTIAGGVILFLIAVKMIFPPRKAAPGEREEPEEEEPFIVPLAVPYVAGPSAAAVVMLTVSSAPGHWPEALFAVFAAWLCAGTILFASVPIGRLLGRQMLTAIERLMGMLLIAISIQMLMTGALRFSLLWEAPGFLK